MRELSVRRSKITVGFKGYNTDVDESLLDMAYTQKAYNFAFENGALTGKIGIDAASGYYPEPSAARHEYPALPQGRSFRNVFVYRRKDENGACDDRLVAHMDNYRFMYTSVFESDGWHDIPALAIDDEVTAVNYNYKGEDVLLLSSKTSPLHILNDSVSSVCSNAPYFSSITVHNERVFGSMNGARNQVWFSEDFNPQNWNVSADGAGYINFADECGEVIKVVSFLNYLYIFREFGIFRLTAFGDQSEFMLKKVFTDTGRIYKSSIELCGDKIIFYASDGLYAFDGYEVRRLTSDIPKLYKPQNMNCAYLDDCYFMACTAFENSVKNNAVIRYGLRDKTVSVLYGYSVKKLRTVRTYNAAQVLCVFDGAPNNNRLGEMSQSGCFLGAATSKRYYSPQSSLLRPSIKTIRHATLQTDTDVTLSVTLDGKEYKFPVRGGKQLRTVPIERSGRRISFGLICDGAEAHVTPVTVTLDALDI